VGRELPASAGAQGGAALDAWIRASVAHYYHPVGTCKMGHDDDDAAAVVDSSGRLRGLDDLWIADCSIIPAIPRANTALPVVVIWIKVAEAMSACRARRG
jgi:choline dehydrogenase